MDFSQVKILKIDGALIFSSIRSNLFVLFVRGLLFCQKLINSNCPEENFTAVNFSSR